MFVDGSHIAGGWLSRTHFSVLMQGTPLNNYTASCGGFNKFWPLLRQITAINIRQTLDLRQGTLTGSFQLCITASQPKELEGCHLTFWSHF